jgi:phosphoribosylaminoimidazolecarboxamide formyltransferase / IMP cyclohydrolase
VATARQLQGKALSYNNINDTDAAYELVAEFDRRRGAGLRHRQARQPLRRGAGLDLAEAYRAAYDCDRTSAFGGIVALNAPLDAATAEAIAEIFTEVVIAPAVTPEAAAVFAAKKNLRLLEAGGLPDPRAPGLALRQVAGGYLFQDRDAGGLDPAALRTVTRRAPTEAERADLLFAWTVAKHVKSNAIVYARGGATVGIGAGQMSAGRLDPDRRAQGRGHGRGAGPRRAPTRGAVVASDAFFPFADGLLAAAEAGATAVIQPGGSVRDAEVIAAADAAGLAMVFTGMRHFRH